MRRRGETDGEEAKREFRGTVVKIEPGIFQRNNFYFSLEPHWQPSSFHQSSRILTLEPRQARFGGPTFMKPVTEDNSLSDEQNAQRAATRP